MTDTLRIIFAGTPDFSVPPLQALIDSEHQIIAVYTQPDRPAGRGRKLTPSPVKRLAMEHDIPVYQPASLKDEQSQQILNDLNADLMVVVAYGLLLPKTVLDAPRLGCINIHASLLPRWRGAAPIQRAILAGDEETGITIMQMDVGLDTGDMLYKKVCPILADDTGSGLHDRLSVLGAEALIEVLPGIVNGTAQGEKQDDDLANYAAKLNKAESQLDWQQPAQQLANQVRAFNGWPVAQTTLARDTDSQVLRVWNAYAESTSANAEPGHVISCDKTGIRVATGEGVLCMTRVQLPGGKPVDVKDFVNAHDLTGQQLGVV